MSILNLLLLGVIVGANNLAVALALGALGQKKRIFRILLIFGAFEFFVPLAGIWMGGEVANYIADHSQLVGSLLLISLGLVTVISGMRSSRQNKKLAEKITTWKGLIVLASGLSMDNIIVGFSLGLEKAEPFVVAGTIAVFSVVFTFAGIHLGRFLGSYWQQITKIVSGILLALLGIGHAVGWI